MRPRIRVVSWNCAGAFREKVGRALDLDADVYVIQEAEPIDRYRPLLPGGTEAHYEARPGHRKGILVFARPGFTLTARQPTGAGSFAYVVPVTITVPCGTGVELLAVWTLIAATHEAGYIGQAHLALDEFEGSLRPGTMMIGDFNSNAIWDRERRRNHTKLVERLDARGLRSAYHYWTGEAQGAESQSTFFLHRNRSKAFHIDHCFTDLEVLDVEVGAYTDWAGLKATGGLSDHVPMIVTVGLSSWAR